MPLHREPVGSIDTLHGYWRSLGDGATPERALIEPMAFKKLLPYLYIVAYEFDPFRVRYILTGTEVDRWNGMNLTGRYVDEFIAADKTGANQILFDCYAEAQATGQPVFGAYQWPMRAGYPLTVKFGMYPLKVDGIVRQCLAIEDYTSFPAEAEIEAVPVVDPAKAQIPTN